MILRGRTDVHHHFTPAEYLAFTAAHPGVGGFGRGGGRGRGAGRGSAGLGSALPGWKLEEDLEDMDKNGTATAVLSITTPGFWFGSVEEVRKVSRECNDAAAKLRSDHPGRFGIFSMLPLPDIDGSLREIEYGFDTLKGDGVYMFTNWGGKALYCDQYLGDPALAPICEELNRRKAVVYNTHPKDPAYCHDSLRGVNGATSSNRWIPPGRS